MCADVTSMRQNKSKLEISHQVKKFENQFNDDKIDILSELNSENYAIDFMNEKELSFMFLYNLSQTELTKLQRYIENALIKN